MLKIECLNRPVRLYLNNGKVFSVDSFRDGRHFITDTFIITHINNEKNCVTLRPLKRCFVCCEDFVFVPTNGCITLNMRSLCGYQLLQDICIRECNHPSIRIRDCICGPFVIPPGNTETVLWHSNMIAKQYGSINLSLEKEDDLLELRIYSNNRKMYESYLLINGETYNFSMNDCTSIKIIKIGKGTTIKGIYQIELFSEIENVGFI